MPSFTSLSNTKSLMRLKLLNKAVIAALSLTALVSCTSQQTTQVTNQSGSIIPAETIVDEIVTNNTTVDETKIEKMLTTTTNSDGLPSHTNEAVSQYFKECSSGFKRQHNTFIQAALTQPYSQIDEQLRHFINSSFGNESLACERGALDFALAVSKNELQSTELLLQTSDEATIADSQSIQPTVSEERKVLAERYGDNVKLDLFDIYLRQAILAEGSEALVYAKEANLLWSEWAVVPIDFSSKQSGVSSIESLEIMKQAVARLNQYLQNHQNILIQKPEKRALMIDQALIYVIQLNEQYTKARQQLEAYSQSETWRENVIADDLQAILGKPGTKEEVDIIIASMITKVTQKQDETIAQFFELARLRYDDFDEAKMLESAKAFILQNIDEKGLSELLTAMDYLRLGDKTASERWLDNVSQNTILMQYLCADDAETKYLTPNQTLFNSTQSQWFKSELIKRCP